jgi:transcriptional regulator with XRE-family HTH domain
MTFGMKLQQVRKSAGMPQTELARLSETSIDSLRNWEQDRAMPKIDAAARLARALGVPLDVLTVGGPAEPRSEMRRLKSPDRSGKRKR